MRNERNIIQMYNYEIQQNKLFIVLEYGELDFQKYLHQNKGNIDNETLRYFWRQVTSKEGCVFPMVIWSEFRMGRIETITIRKTHPTLYVASIFMLTINLDGQCCEYCSFKRDHSSRFETV